MSWDKQHESILRDLWNGGHSASVIARTLGKHVTRNAVIGKVHRLKLAGRRVVTRSHSPHRYVPLTLEQKALKNERKRQLRALQQPKKRKRVRLNQIPVTDAPPSLNLSLVNLGRSMCRFIAGEPNGGFCGHLVFAGSSWCAYHYRVVYQPHVDRSNAPLAASRLTGQIVEPMEAIGTSQAAQL